MKIEEALRMYVAQLRANGRSAATIGQARRHVRQLGRYLPEHRVEEVSHEDVARFFGSPCARYREDGRPKKPTSVNALRSTLRSFFSYVHKAGIATHDAAALLRRVRLSAAPPRGLSASEKERLVAVLAAGNGSAAERDRVLFGLMLGSGIRIGSALGLEVEDVDYEEGVLRLRSWKGGGSGIAYLPPAQAAELRRYIGARKCGAVFVGAGGKRLGARQVHRRLVGWCAKAGIERRVSPHALRHSFAIALYERTGDVLIVQAALGHRSIESTTVYARPMPERVRAAVDDILTRSHPEPRLLT